MSEKLATFVTLYKEKATKDVEQYKEFLTTAKEKSVRAIALWNQIKAEAEKLGIVESFTKAFPEPGGKVIVKDGVNPNPSYMLLFDYGDDLKNLVRELTKLDNVNRKLKNAETNLTNAQSYLTTKPEDYLATLESALFKMIAEAQSQGAKSVAESLLGKESTYEEFEEIMRSVDGAEGPSGVKSSPQVYELLKEKFEAGAFTKKSEKKETESPINTPGETKGEGAQSSAINPPTKTPSGETAPGSGVNPEKATPTATESSTTTAPAAVPEVPKEAPVKTESSAINVNVTTKAPETPPASAPAPPPANAPAGTAPPPASAPAPPPANTTVNTFSNPLNIGGTTNVSFQTLTSLQKQAKDLLGVKEKSKKEISDKLETSTTNNTINDKVTQKVSEKTAEKNTTNTTVKSESTTPQINDKTVIRESKPITVESLKGEASKKTNMGESFLAFSQMMGDKQNKIAKTPSSINDKKDQKGVEPTVEIKKESEKTALPEEKKESSLGANVGSIEITKNLPNLPAPVETKREEKKETMTLEKVEETAAKGSKREEKEESKPNRREEPTEKREERREERQEKFKGIGMDALENRLARIELLLAGPLEVKIVD